MLWGPCETTRHGCSLWCLYPHYPFSIHIFYLVRNIEKTSLVKILGKFSFVLIYYHWKWFDDLHHVQGIEIKDDSEMHMSPWPPSWLSAGIDECCRSANESGHQWLKNSWLDTSSVKWTVVQHFQLSAVVRLSECRKKHSFYSRKRKHSGCQWRVEAVAGAVGPDISGSCSTDSTSRKDTANVANIPKTTMFNWPINTNHDLQTLHLCTDQELK